MPRSRPAPTSLVFFVLSTFLALACGKDSTGVPPTGAIQIKVVTTSTIADIDTASYTVSIDGGLHHSLGVSAAIKIDGVPKATHSVKLDGWAPYCTVTSYNPFVVDVNAAQVVPILFTVDCEQPTGGPSPWDY